MKAEAEEELQQKMEEAKQKEQAARAAATSEMSQQMMNNLEELMEAELVCSICSEYFVQATTLNCSHTYCAACISQWLQQQGTPKCPHCRAEVTSRVGSLVLDNYIDRVVEQMGDEAKTSRKKLKEERKGANLVQVDHFERFYFERFSSTLGRVFMLHLKSRMPWDYLRISLIDNSWNN